MWSVDLIKELENSLKNKILKIDAFTKNFKFKVVNFPIFTKGLDFNFCDFAQN